MRDLFIGHVLSEDGIFTLHHLNCSPEVHNFTGCKFERLILLIGFSHEPCNDLLFLRELSGQQLPLLDVLGCLRSFDILEVSCLNQFSEVHLHLVLIDTSNIISLLLGLNFLESSRV